MSKSQNELKTAFEMANKVAQTAKKLDYYQEAGKDAPEKLLTDLEHAERALDSHIKKILPKMENLKGDLLDSPELSDDNARELEWSYKKAVGFAQSAQGVPSRMFFLPFVYERGEDGKRKGLPNFSKDNLALMGRFIGEFVAAGTKNTGWRENEDGEALSIDVRLIPPVFEWVVLEEEEKALPILHQAMIDGKTLNMKELFETHRRISEEGWVEVSGGDSNWFAGALPFAILSKNEDFLESIDFMMTDDDFVEQFESIFVDGQGIAGTWGDPIDPHMMADTATRLLWERQTRNAFDAGVAARGKRMMTVELIVGWWGGEMSRVSVEITMQDKNGDTTWGRQVSRWPLPSEDFRDVADWLMSMLEQPDFQTVFVVSHERTNPDED